MTPSPRLPVICVHCGWTSKRLPGKPVRCPTCGSFAAFKWPEKAGKDVK